MAFFIRHMINLSGYTILIAFLITRLKSFKQLVLKEKLNKKDIIILSITFGLFGVFGTYSGLDVKGAILNSRNIGVIVGGIFCGPIVGTVAGLIAGAHRLLIDVGGPTALPCAIATIIGGFVSGTLYNRVKKKDRWLYGSLVGTFIEHISFGLILLLTKPFDLAFDIVKIVYLPMILTNGIGIPLIIKLTENLFNEKELVAARQSEFAFEIAEKTLPFFRSSSGNAFEGAAKVIMESIGASAVAFTDRNYILAHVGEGSDHHIRGTSFFCKPTKLAIENNEMQILNSSTEIGCKFENCPLKSGLVAPLVFKDMVRGTLKIYFDSELEISYKDRVLIEGLSKLISTQLELLQLNKLEEMANKAEIRALQAQIHPHFLFNALNTVVSYVRVDPNKARDLICDLSTFLRHNMENQNYMTSLEKEIEHVKAYVKIEQARFGDKLLMVYEIDENITMPVPNLIIQPIVENAFKHGYDESKGLLKVKVVVKKNKNDIDIEIIDNGVGISEECIGKVYSSESTKEGIGLTNVHMRLRLLYGSGLEIENVEVGTIVRFKIPMEAV